MMLHQDVSKHLWLPAPGRQIDPIVTRDDAARELYSSFLVEEEGTASSLRGLQEVAARHGLFWTFYTGRGGHCFSTPKAGKDTPTQAGRALAQPGIRHIAAYLPEARGRSERMFETLQDRLVKNSPARGSTPSRRRTGSLAGTCLPAHNRRFAVTAAGQGSAFVPWAGGGLAEILCHQEDRIAGNGNTVVSGRLRLQIEPSPLRAHFVLLYGGFEVILEA